MILEIKDEKDKREVSAILVANGYTVKKTTILIANRKRVVIEATKESVYAKDE